MEKIVGSATIIYNEHFLGYVRLKVSDVNKSDWMSAFIYCKVANSYECL